MTGAALYRKVADDLKAAAAAGTYPPDMKLPAENELAERYPVSRGTIRQGGPGMTCSPAIAEEAFLP